METKHSAPMFLHRRWSARLLVPALCLLLMSCGNKFDGAHKFDPAQWKAADCGSGVRLEMLPNLIDTERLVGRTRDEIITLLGEAAPTGFPLGARGWDLVYCIGPSAGVFAMDNTWLFLRLKDGTVTEHRTFED